MLDDVLPVALALLAGAVLALLIVSLSRLRRAKSESRAERGRRQRVFIWYQVNTDPDQELARGLYQSLAQDHDVFMVDKIRLGTPQREQLLEALGASQWFIAVLSRRSVNSSELAELIGQARQRVARGGMCIIPVRVRHQGSLARLGLDDNLCAATWDAPEDTPALLAELADTIAAGLQAPLPPPPAGMAPHPPLALPRAQFAAEHEPPEMDYARAPGAAARRTRLIDERDELQRLIDEHYERLRYLRRQRLIETDPLRQFQLDQQLAAEDRQIDEHEQRLAAIERELQKKRPPTLAQPGGPVPPEAAAEPTEGAMASDSPLYIARSADREALDRIRRSDITIVIRGPRQVGKSSLLMRIIQEAEQARKRPVFLDFQSFDKADFASDDRFFQEFFRLLTDKLGLKSEVEEFWNNKSGNRWRGTKYMSEYLLAEIQQPILLAMDEVDRLLPTTFRTDFFGMLRSWHNARAQASSPFRRLDLVIIIATDPDLLIDKETESPFNVAEKIWLRDFTLDEVKELNYRYGRLLAESPELLRLYKLLNGHPYLVRKALYSVYCDRTSVEGLFKHAASDQGVFADHLQRQHKRLVGDPQLSAGLFEVIEHSSCRDPDVLFRLRAAGLIREESGKLLPRCKLYADYFKAYLYNQRA